MKLSVRLHTAKVHRTTLPGGIIESVHLRGKVFSSMVIVVVGSNQIYTTQKESN